MNIISEAKKKIIVQREPSTNVNKILEAIMLYDNLSLSDFPGMAEEKREYIQKQLNSKPNPSEQREWNDIDSQKGLYKNSLSDAELLLNAISQYIRKWEGSRPSGNHVNEANTLYDEVESFVKKKKIEEEEEDWAKVNIDSMGDLIGHLSKYPSSVHKQEIDDLFWDNTNKENISDVDEYLQYFPDGSHKNDAESVKKAIIVWLEVKNTNDIFEINSYIKNNPNSPFVESARILLLTLKQQEISSMKNNPSAYEVGTLMRFLNEGIFTERELINQDVLTKRVIDILKDPDLVENLPDIQLAIDNSTPECKDGYTDIYFFGIPSTGKTCILMGLSRSNSLHINLAHGGGDYAAALQQFIDAGVTVPQTKMGFVATLEATINEREQNSVHKINLIEMAGEDFARKIAGNQEHIFDFDAMGTGATDLLKNDNKKVFFLIIDPTTNVIRYNRREVVGYDEETGDPIYDLVKIRCNQQTLIDKMVALFAYPGNAEIMKKVDSIHIIMTKADLLGDEINREERALNEFNVKYGSNILDPLIDLCKEYNINVQTKYYPKLYTFSLGKFYVGGVYEYDSTDSNKLVNAIRNATGTIKKETLWDKVKKIVN